jgi:hypothetical protein
MIRPTRTAPTGLPLNDRRRGSQRCNSQLPLATYRGNTPFAYRHLCPPGNLWRDKGHYLRRCNRSRRSALPRIARAPKLRSEEIAATLDYRRSRKGGKGGQPGLSPPPPALAKSGASQFLGRGHSCNRSRQTVGMRPRCLGGVGNRPHFPPTPRDLKSKAPPGEQWGRYFSDATAELGRPHLQPSRSPVRSVFINRGGGYSLVPIARIVTMTIPRLAAIAFVCLVFIDMKFGGGRIVDALWDQAKSVGYSLNNELQGLTYRLARH